MSKQEHPDKEILDLLPRDGDRAIEMLFRKYYAFLCKAIFRIIPDEGTAEDIAQEVFLEIWKKRAGLKINISLKAYLRRAGINKALNHIRDRKIKWDEPGDFTELKSGDVSASKKMEAKELQIVIDKAINELPERCRIVFSLSRFEEMSYREIAEHMGISVKTVENQISKALRQLRLKLGPYLSGGILFAVILADFF